MEDNEQEQRPKRTATARTSYFSTQEEHRVYLDPDFDEDDPGDVDASYVTVKEMSEGDRARYQRNTTKDIKIKKDTGDNAFEIDQGAERRELLKISLVGWDIVDADQNAFPFTATNIDKIAKNFNPKTIDHVIAGIRDVNEWMANEDDPEVLEKEIVSMQARLEKALEREAQKNS